MWKIRKANRLQQSSTGIAIPIGSKSMETDLSETIFGKSGIRISNHFKKKKPDQQNLTGFGIKSTNKESLFPFYRFRIVGKELEVAALIQRNSCFYFQSY